VLSYLLTASASALETDQYYSWGRPLADSTDVINAKFDLELQAAIDSFEAPPESCTDVTIRFRKRMRFVLFHPIQTWTMNTSLVARVPADGDEDLVFRRSNMYNDHGPLDVGMWMPLTPTIQVNGIRIGTEKLSHFVSSGWYYSRRYRRLVEKGASPAEAERAALRRGILEERLILGAATSGITSIADLEAGYQGMHFYLDLCSGEDPILDRIDGRWTIRRPIDLRDYVHPGWDESYRNSIFAKRRWKKVEPALRQYCDRLEDPKVLAMLRHYDREDRFTLVQEVIAELVDEGRFADPDRFSIWAVCGRDPPPPEPDLEIPGSAPDSAGGEDPELIERIIAHDRATERRTIRTIALRLSHPQVASASLGWIFTRQPVDYDCRTPCDHWGPFTQIEPGLGGGKLSLGWGRVIGEQRRGRIALSSVYLAMGLKASVLRTWGDDSREPANQSYLGPEFEFSVARVNMGIGFLNLIDGATGSDWIMTWYFGWGF
jgi:hypothetical protein